MSSSGTDYEIRILGPLPEEALELLGELSVAPSEAATVLTMRIADQPALLGVLARLRSLHLDVVEVRQLHLRRPAVERPTSSIQDDAAEQDGSAS
ncbi:hypothetical protein [Georgenia sp. SUBG003]|uniref:hypothetical protein n=1 Tax=Georgenia sp. SUBG003 TaxID=1497974 RepID=UPI0004D4851D|nr:hypothetical protein DA06_05830 [Georgenia sp. SUBG003]